jgi:hypothetical protein
MVIYCNQILFEIFRNLPEKYLPEEILNLSNAG